MSRIKIVKTDKLNKKDLLSYLMSLDGDIQTVNSHKINIYSNNLLHRYSLVTECCRKLDTLNIKYEVIE